MSGSLTVRQASLVLPDRVVVGDLVVQDGVISEIAPRVEQGVGTQIDGRGCALLPGVVDAHVRLDAAEDLGSISRAAVAGGVTTVLGVHNATTSAQLRAELAQAEERAGVHFGLAIRADGHNLTELLAAGRARAVWVPGEILCSPAAEEIFAEVVAPLWVDNRDPRRLAERRHLYPDEHDPALHPRLHDIDSALAATRLALELATKHGQRTHLLHIGSSEEVELLREWGSEHVTVAARPPQLTLDSSAYTTLGTRAVTEPPLRSPRHGEALWQALLDGVVHMVASGHMPVRPANKHQPWPDTHPGMPVIEWLLPLMLDAASEGRCTLSQVARWTSEAPASRLGVPRKGRLEVGYDGDLVLVDTTLARVVGADAPIRGTCGWSPWEGQTLTGWPILTTLLGEPVFRDGEVLEGVRGRPL